MSESQHWYTRAGQPRHWVEKADGSGLRATTLRDARKENLVPSFSTVDSIRSKFQLNRYLIREAIRETLNLPPIFEGCRTYESPDEYVDTVMAHLDETKGERTGSDMGTEIHDSIESVAKGGEPTTGYEEHTEAALNEVARLFPDVTDWISERTFANPMGFGGMVDLHSPSTGICVDFKTKGGDLERKMDYDQYIQLATYQRGLMLPSNACANVFVSRTHPGIVSSHVWDLDILAKGWNMFQYEFGLWCLDKDYDPSWIPGEEEEAA